MCLPTIPNENQKLKSFETDNSELSEDSLPSSLPEHSDNPFFKHRCKAWCTRFPLSKQQWGENCLLKCANKNVLYANEHNTYEDIRFPI